MLRWLPLAFMLLEFSIAGAQGISYPKASSTTTTSSNTLTAGETIDVAVRIDGDTRSQSEAVPTTVLLVLDRSGSMSRENAIGHLKQAAALMIDKLNPQQDSVAIVAFSNNGSMLSPATNDFASAKRAIAALSASGATNIADGFSLGNSILRGSTTTKRVAILMTDGIPEPDPARQGQAIYAELKTLSADLITYHTVGLGTVDPILLDTIARRTGGTFTATSSPGELDALFSQIYDAQSKSLTIKDLMIHEELSPFLTAEHSSLHVSFIPPSNDAQEFSNAIAAVEPGFYANGALDFPSLYDVPGKLYFSYSFKARVTKCDSGQDIAVPLRAQSAGISFLNGSGSRVKYSMTATPITIRTCGVYLEKTFDENAKQVHVNVKNSLPRSIRNVVLVDQVTDNFDYVRDAETSPLPFRLDHASREIEWHLDSIQSNTVQSLVYYLKDTVNLPPAVYPVEFDDDLSFWTFETPALNIHDAIGEYREMESSIISGAASPKLNRYIEQQLALPARPRNGTISSAIPELRKEGFEWQLTYVPGSDIKFPAGPKTGPFFDDYTGVFFIRKHDRFYEVLAEVRRRARLPMIRTSPMYEPRS